MRASYILTSIYIIFSITTLAFATTQTYTYPFNPNAPDNLYYKSGHNLGTLNVGFTVNITLTYANLSSGVTARKFSTDCASPELYLKPADQSTYKILTNAVLTSSCTIVGRKCAMSYGITASSFSGLSPPSTATSGDFRFYPGCSDTNFHVYYFTIQAVAYNTSSSGSSVGSTNVQTLLSLTETGRGRIFKIFYVATKKNITITTSPKSTVTLSKLFKLTTGPTIFNNWAYGSSLVLAGTDTGSYNNYTNILDPGYYVAKVSSSATVAET